MTNRLKKWAPPPISRREAIARLELLYETTGDAWTAAALAAGINALKQGSRYGR